MNTVNISGNGNVVGDGNIVVDGDIVTHVHLPPAPLLPAGSGIPPSNAARFIERGEVMQQVRQRLREGQRTALVGVRGMGGVGKTELAIALAQEFEAQAPNSVLWVEVGDRPVEELQATLARALGVTLPPACSRQQALELLQAAFKASPLRLVVFDDVREPCLSALHAVLPPAPLAVLCTTRYHLEALPAGSVIELDVMTETQALDLLRAVPGLEDALARESEAAQELVKLCGYHPLALDLAARRLLKWLPRPIGDFNVRLREERLAILQVSHGRTPTLASLEANLDLSYQALNPREKRRFRALGICRGGFTPDLAAALWTCTTDEAENTLEMLADASLVSRADALGRRRMHDLLQDYALRRLVEADQKPRAFSALADWLIALFIQHATDSPATAPHVVGELANLRAAVRWAVEQQNGDLLAWLATIARNWLFAVFGNYEEWRTWLETALVIGISEERLCANVLKNLGDLEFYAGHLDKAKQQYEAALFRYKIVQDNAGKAAVLHSLGRLKSRLDDFDTARKHYTEALSLYEAAQDRLAQAQVLQSLGDLEKLSGHVDKAREFYEGASSLYEAA